MGFSDDDMYHLLVDRGDEDGVLVAKAKQLHQVLLQLGLDAADVAAVQIGDAKLVATTLELQLIAGAELGGRLGPPHVGELGERGLAAFLDEQPRVDWRGRRCS